MQTEVHEITVKLNRLTDLLIEGHIMPDIYNEKNLDLDLRRKNLLTDMKENHSGDSDFKIAICGIIALLSKSPQIFQSSNIAEKRALLGLVFSNLQLEGSTLRYSLRKPFDQFVKASNCQGWCRLGDSNT